MSSACTAASVTSKERPPVLGSSRSSGIVLRNTPSLAEVLSPAVVAPVFAPAVSPVVVPVDAPVVPVVVPVVDVPVVVPVVSVVVPAVVPVVPVVLRGPRALAVTQGLVVAVYGLELVEARPAIYVILAVGVARR
jgi:hypothetical protein